MNPHVATALIGWLITAALIGITLLTTDDSPLEIGAKLFATIIGVFSLAISFLAAAGVTSSILSRRQHHGQ